VRRLKVIFWCLWGFISCFNPLFASASQQEITVLKEQLKLLMQRIETLEKNQKAPQEGLVQPQQIVAKASDLPKPTPPLQVASGNNKIQLALSGQVNRFVSFESNGKNSQVSHKDNAFSSTRLNFTGKGALNDETTISGVVEVEIRSDTSSTRDIGTASDASSTVFLKERRLEAIIDNKRYGKVWLGQGPMASDSTSEVDYSGTDVITSGSEIQDQAGGVKFFNKRTNQKDARTIATAFDNYGQSFRQDRVRYDTPNFNGFVLGGGHATRDISDAALKYAGEYGKSKFGAAIAFAKNPFSGAARKGWDQYNGSASILFPAGISLMGAIGQRNFKDKGRDPGKYWYGKIGYQFNYFAIGKTALAIDYAWSKAIADDAAFTLDNFKVINTERFNSYGFVVAQSLDPVATEVYAAARTHQLKRQGDWFHKILSFVAGVRIKL
jgi:predicted porin